jgi:AraC family transcriptional regulator
MSPIIEQGSHYGIAAGHKRIGGFHLSKTTFLPHLRTPPHEHEAPAFSLVLKGHYHQRFRRQEILYSQSTVVFRPSAIEHTDCIGAVGATCFIIEPDAVWLTETHLARLNGDYALCHTGTKARWLFQHALQEFRSPDKATPLAIEGLVIALGAEFDRGDRDRRESRPAPWLLRAREAVDAAFTESVTLAGLAADSGVHPVHLAAAFRTAFGCSVGEYVRARRVTVACESLRDSAQTLSAIAAGLGFSSQSHFTRVFREQTGMTPLAYRRMHSKQLES